MTSEEKNFPASFVYSMVKSGLWDLEKMLQWADHQRALSQNETKKIKKISLTNSSPMLK